MKLVQTKGRASAYLPSIFRFEGEYLAVHKYTKPVVGGTVSANYDLIDYTAIDFDKFDVAEAPFVKGSTTSFIMLDEGFLSVYGRCNKFEGNEDFRDFIYELMVKKGFEVEKRGKNDIVNSEGKKFFGAAHGKDNNGDNVVHGFFTTSKTSILNDMIGFVPTMSEEDSSQMGATDITHNQLMSVLENSSIETETVQKSFDDKKVLHNL